MAEGLDGVEGGGAAGGEPAGEETEGEEEHSDRGEDEGIVRRDADEQAAVLHEVRDAECAGKTKGESEAELREAAGKDQLKDASGSGAKRHADADFAGAADRGLGDDAVDAH